MTFRRFAVLLAFVAATPLLAQSDPPGTAHPNLWPKMSAAVALDGAVEQRIDGLLKKMTVEEKVGQVIQAGITKVTPAEAKQYHLGSILNGGGGWPGDVHKARPTDWLKLADDFYDASMDTTGGRLAIPIMWGSDAVHGHSNIIGATIFPHNVALGAMHDPALVRRIGEATAAEMRVTGADWNFSPTVAVARDRRWGRSYESYSEEPEIVAAYASKMVEGLQGAVGSKSFLKSGRVIATAKHFLGDGGTDGGKDQGNTLASEMDLRLIHAAGYIGALESGVQSVMVSFSSWQGVKMHGNATLLTGVLKERMGFDGILVGDWNAHGQVPGCTNSDCPQAFNAGLDMFMVPEDWKALYENTVKEVKSGVIPQARLDDAVRRILRVKMRAGLFTAGKPSKRPGGGDLTQLGSKAHREIARQAVRESLVLLKNNGGVLPIDARKNVLVAGDGADNIPKQCGGWTITWQGDGNTNADFPGATSVWGGIRAAVKAAGGHATLSPDGSFTTKPDVAVVVFGEDPYAEFSGDRDSLVWAGEKELALLGKLKEAGIPVVSIFLSGRPLWVNPHINASDAFVAAWLPGSEGEGVADVILAGADGKPAYDFRGTLAFSWPKLAIQSQLNRSDPGYDPLFALGYGMRYGDQTEVANLSVETGGMVATPKDVLFTTEAVAPWNLIVGEQGAQPVIAATGVKTPRGTVTVGSATHGTKAVPLIAFSGTGVGTVYLASDPGRDLTRETNGDMAVSFEIAQMKQPEGPVALVLSGGAIDIGPILRSLPTGEWRTVRVRLRCFADRGADMAHVQTAFQISTGQQMSLAVAQIRLVPADPQDVCPGGTLN